MQYDRVKNMINRFVDISQLCDGVWSFIGRSPGIGGDPRMYLVTGTEQALLIDTGFGIGDLKGLVEFYTKLPVTVVNTHFHGDHCGGNAQFGSAYIHEMDYNMLANTPPFTFDIPRDTFFTQEDVIEQKPYEIRTFKTGHIFDLGGGFEIEVLHTPGHSAGGSSFLDIKRKMLYTGDAIVYTPTFLFGYPGTPNDPNTTVESFRDSLLVLQKRKHEFDGLFPGHHNMNLSPDYVDNMIACCEEIMENPNCNEEIQCMDFSVLVEGATLDIKIHLHDRAMIAYTDEKIYKTAR